MQALLLTYKSVAVPKNFQSLVDVFVQHLLPAIMLACGCIVGLQVSLKPLSCHANAMPSTFGLEDFVAQYCQIADKYIIDPSTGSSYTLLFKSNLYLWLPLILFLQACSLYIPRTFWSHFGNLYNYQFFYLLPQVCK